MRFPFAEYTIFLRLKKSPLAKLRCSSSLHNLRFIGHQNFSTSRRSAVGSRDSGTSIPEISATVWARPQDLFQDWSMNRSKRSVCRSNRRRKSRSHVSLGVVGANGFEPSTSWSRTMKSNSINALSGVAYGTRSLVPPFLVVRSLYVAQVGQAQFATPIVCDEP